MKFNPAIISGVFLIEIEPQSDERGFFARSWCREEFARHGLNAVLSQCSISFNLRRGTLRGMHHQVAPHPEAKLVRCTAGAIYDVALDLRPDSGTFGRWQAFELNAANRHMVYVPEGVAHGFQTLADGSEVFYQISEPHYPECARGVRWDDPAFNIAWPLPVSVLSEKDRSYPLLNHVPE